MEQSRTPRMTIPTQLVLRALLADPTQERYGVEIGAAAGLPSGTVHPILARLETVGWLTSRWEDIDPRAEGRPARRYYQLTPDGHRAGPGRPGPRLHRHRPARLAATSRGRAVTSLIGSRGTGQAGQPTWWAAWAVRSASLPLPSEHRWRYRQEFLAELHGMTPAEQLHHATGVLSRVWTLRVALNEPQRRLVQEAAKTKPWRCQLRLHRWQRLRNPEGGWYRECRGCGTQRVSSGTGGPIINAWPHRTSGDQLALGALREAAGPLRVSGWDDSDVAREHRLTTVAQSLREQGAACATAALGDPAPDHRGGLAIGPAGIHRRLTRSPVMGSMDGVDLRCWLVGVTGLEPVTSSL